MKIYFDSAATSQVDEQVAASMQRILTTTYGNPSSVHAFGRQAKVELENARKTVADRLNIAPGELFFTSCGTEANNTAIYGSILDLGVKRVISSAIEHHAVLHTLQNFVKRGHIRLDFVQLNEKGKVDLQHLESLLRASEEPTLVSLMHANNEIGNLLPIKDVSRLCRKYGAFFHSDMVQSAGKYKIDLQAIDLDFASFSAHKFHGAKGVGALYINGEKVKINPLLWGGAQERNMRGGTENLHGIVGMAKALEVACGNMPSIQQKVGDLKNYLIEKLENSIKGIEFLGESRDKGLYNIVNVLMPENKYAEMLINRLDVAGIAASSGSACSSGSNKRSHVLDTLAVSRNRHSIRFSFSKYNTREEIDFCVDFLSKLLN